MPSFKGKVVGSMHPSRRLEQLEERVGRKHLAEMGLQTLVFGSSSVSNGNKIVLQHKTIFLLSRKSVAISILWSLIESH